MTTRTDILFDLQRSPRIAEVAKASDDIIMQDYVDTIRPFESSFRAMSHPFLMDATGKQDLGGGVLVAITAEEQDLKLAFESDFVAAETGTVTTGSGMPDLNNEYTFEDSTAFFETNLVMRGSFLINYTDQSVADVVEVLSETMLTTTVLMNGSDNEWDINDDYQCFNITQKRTAGGNLVAVDSLDVTFPAILPTAFTQVVQQSSSSATIQNLDTMESQIADIHGQVQREVWIDTNFPTNGNFGYQQAPFNTWTDGVDYAEANNLFSLALEDDAIVDRQIKNFNLRGVNFPGIDLNGQEMDGTTVSGCNITGAHLGQLLVQDAGVSNVSGELLAQRVAVFGTYTVRDAALSLVSNVTVLVAGQPWTLDLGASGASGSTVGLSEVSGGLIIANVDHAADVVHVHMAQGAVTINASCTAGNIVITGLCEITDNSAGSIVLTSASLGQTQVESSVWDALIADHSVSGSFGEFIVRRLLTTAKFFALK